MDDLISRSKTYDTLTDCYHHTTEIQHKALREALERVPDADLSGYSDKLWRNAYERCKAEAQRKKGKWLPDNKSVYEMRFACSECHESEVVPTIGFTKYKPIWDFCPNCGADMREDAEEPKKCDTCKHVKEPWFERCADCSDYELWESKE